MFRKNSNVPVKINQEYLVNKLVFTKTSPSLMKSLDYSRGLGKQRYAPISFASQFDVNVFFNLNA